MTYGYGRGRLTSVNGWADLTYHPNGTVATVDHDNGVTDTINQDTHGLPRPASISTSGATIIGSTTPRNWSSGSYSWDGAGNVTGIGPDWYVYDPLSRLVESRQHEEAWQGGKVWWQGFSFDSFGNRFTRETKDVRFQGFVWKRKPLEHGTLPQGWPQQRQEQGLLQYQR